MPEWAVLLTGLVVVVVCGGGLVVFVYALFRALETTHPGGRGYRVQDFHNKTPDPKRASCGDCKYHVAYVTWWCTNREAIKYRGTSMGGRNGVIECPFWEPYRDLTPEEQAAA